tara:strand:+ start:1076 stop:1549 length:474 start_codon:yes stop_codon:yes gene_type:complete
MDEDKKNETIIEATVGKLGLNEEEVMDGYTSLYNDTKKRFQNQGNAGAVTELIKEYAATSKYWFEAFQKGEDDADQGVGNGLGILMALLQYGVATKNYPEATAQVGRLILPIEAALDDFRKVNENATIEFIKDRIEELSKTKGLIQSQKNLLEFMLQ